MDHGLIGTKGSRASLETTWKRYAAITKAISNVGDVEWESGKKPVDSEIITVYVAKSAYYDQLKVLQHIRLHDDMVEWLERSEFDANLAGQTETIWGYYKAAYTLRDLEKWLAQKQSRKAKEAGRKGKKKENFQSRKKNGRQDEDGDDSSSTSPSKRAHKKSVGGRK